MKTDHVLLPGVPRRLTAYVNPDCFDQASPLVEHDVAVCMQEIEPRSWDSRVAIMSEWFENRSRV